MPDSSNSFSTLLQRARQAARNAQESCDLCGEPIATEHRHLLELTSREMLCACRACTLLFDNPAAGRGTRRLIPTRYQHLTDFRMTDAQWESLSIPVHMAFFVHNTAAQRVLALYPSPAGPTESLLTLETWEELELHNPVLRQMEPDVEALLLNRIRDTREYFLVPIDECYRLVGIIRSTWKGLSGGPEVQRQIDQFFALLKEKAGARGARHA
jgi:Family of unknown function (DUF5947)